jgi:NADH dehydrogenase (ubiquinone) Fe-S protein 1
MQKKFINIYINNIKLHVNKKITIIQAILLSDTKVDIPRFCFHEKLSIAGNCRMCLVDIDNMSKPIASCAIQVIDGMVINTNTFLVKKAREGILEFLLANHPLDCPICDQGGECDLQDQAMLFGGDKGRFYGYKRSVEDKNCGPFVKTIMTRCIHCTRCIRFLKEVAGISTFGLLGRGQKLEIGTYLNKYLFSEVSGNIIDLCPVGALTAKPYAYNARAWELTTKEAIDILDSMCADIRIDIRGTKVLRILPRLNEKVNDNWITDITRFSYDGLNIQRITNPMVFDINLNGYKSIGWNNLLVKWIKYYYITSIILKKKINYSFYIGQLNDAETLIILKDFSNFIGSSNFKTNLNNNSNIDFRQNYILTFHKNDLYNCSLLFLVGLNLRLESPLYNLKLRKLFLKKKFLILVFNSTLNLTYYAKHIGLSYKSFLLFLEGRSFISNLSLSYIKNSYILLGSSLLQRQDFLSFIIFLNNINKKYFFNKFKLGYLQTNIGYLISNELGLSKGLNYFNDKTLDNFKNLNIFYKSVLNYNFIINYYGYLELQPLLNNFNIFLGSSYSPFVLNSVNSFKKSNFLFDILFPGNIFLEKNSFYLNLEGIVKNITACLPISKNVLFDWKIFIILYFKYNNFFLKYKNYVSLTFIKFSYNYYLNYIVGVFLLNNFKNIKINNIVLVLLLLFNTNTNTIFYLYILSNNNIQNYFNKLFNCLYYFEYYYISNYILKLNNINNDFLLMKIRERLLFSSQLFNNKNLNKIILNINFKINIIFDNKIILKLNNYPLHTLQDNYLKSNIISHLSLNINKANNIFKLFFSNYLL